VAVAAERKLLNQLDGGCHLPFGVNIQGAGKTWRLEAFYADPTFACEPLRFTLDGTDPGSLGAAAWERIAAYRKG
jgi:porphobilinogen deaminase